MPLFPAAHALLTEAIREYAFPGAAYGVLLRGEVLAVESAGCFTYEPDAPPVLPETIFDMASVSKVLATTAMAMLLWERGQLDLDAPIAERLPAFIQDEPADSSKRAITARMLLAHSSGLPAYKRLFERCDTAQALLDACLRIPLTAAPGTQIVYSDIGFIVLGHLLETLAGEQLDRYCQREVFAPLGMESTMYCPPPELQPSIPPTAIDDFLRHRVLQGEVHDDNCWMLGGVCGHAGVFSNVADTLRFAACILRGGESIFRPQTVSLFTTRCPDINGDARALGWDVPSKPSSSGQFFGTHSAGHLGYTGTSLWIDFDKELAVVLLTNRTFPGSGPEATYRKIQEVRPLFHDAVIREFWIRNVLEPDNSHKQFPG
jgi:CubicO group peptidase (beta-lactamase class C family)